MAFEGDRRNDAESICPTLDYHIIGSGSTGNAVRIGKVMIDCGMPYKDMKEDLYKCDTLLITHIHTDHLKKQTFLSILSDFPRIKTFANPTVAYQIYINEVISTYPFKTPSGLVITPYEGRHDTEVTYFTWEQDGLPNAQGAIEKLNIIYATDTNLVENPNRIKFDYLFLESNYDEQKLNEIAKQYARKGYDPWTSSHRHLSTQQSKAFYYMNRRSPESCWIELHKSGRFY